MIAGCNQPESAKVWKITPVSRRAWLNTAHLPKQSMRAFARSVSAARRIHIRPIGFAVGDFIRETPISITKYREIGKLNNPA